MSYQYHMNCFFYVVELLLRLQENTFLSIVHHNQNARLINLTEVTKATFLELLSVVKYELFTSHSLWDNFVIFYNILVLAYMTFHVSTT